MDVAFHETLTPHTFHILAKQRWFWVSSGLLTTIGRFLPKKAEQGTHATEFNLSSYRYESSPLKHSKGTCPLHWKSILYVPLQCDVLLSGCADPCRMGWKAPKMPEDLMKLCQFWVEKATTSTYYFSVALCNLYNTLPIRTWTKRRFGAGQCRRFLKQRKGQLDSLDSMKPRNP